jgi:sugar phosphate permease
MTDYAAIYGARTGSDGKFAFPAVSPGRYRLVANAPGYVSAEYGQKRMNGAGLPAIMLMLGAVSFLLIGPYSLLAGVMALDLGGKKGSATAAGLFDSAGYFGSVLSGYGIAVIAQRRGWPAAFGALSAVTACTFLITLLYWAYQRTPRERWRPVGV